VSDLIAKIGSSAAEQSTGVAQVDQAVVHPCNITQQNAALVEQSTVAVGEPEAVGDAAGGGGERVSVME